VKFATYQSSTAVPARELVDRCRRTLVRTVAAGFDAVVTSQQENLDRFWDRADVRLDVQEDAVRAQQSVRWNIFQLGQASWRAEGSGIPAKGLTGQAYEGHDFWDAEIYVLPFLAYTQPRIARNLLRFRYAMLDTARARARTMSQRGAMFPWRTINGEEASAYYQAGTAQYHINADIAHAIQRYVDVGATSRSSPTWAPRCSSRPPACGRTSASTAPTGGSTSTPSPARTSTRRSSTTTPSPT
jgi:alpha,alpha-trehalose phosphorylase